jgi:uncharacterized protein DUF11
MRNRAKGAVLGLLAAVLLLPSAHAGTTGAAGLAVTVSGATQVLTNNWFSLQVQVANTRGDAVALQGVTLTATLPELGTNESLAGIGGAVCLGDGNGHLNCELGTIAAGNDVTVVFAFTAGLSAGTLHHEFSASSSTPADSAGGSQDVAVAAAPPQPPPVLSDLATSITDAVREGGLDASHSFTVRNNGPDPAASVTGTDQLVPGEQLRSVTPSQGTCSLQDSTVQCNFGALASGASATAVVATKMPPAPTGEGHHANVSGSIDPDVGNDGAFAAALFPGRFWLCHVCAYLALPDGTQIPGPDGMSVLADDTVVLRNGMRIRRDGSVDLNDGRCLPPGTNVPVACSGGGGSGSQPPPPPPATPPPPPTVTPTPTAMRPANVNRPTIAGPARVGGTLRANRGSWTGSAVSWSFRWQVCARTCSAIRNANRQTFRVAERFAGRRIRVIVIARNAAGTTRVTSPTVKIRATR